MKHCNQQEWIDKFLLCELEDEELQRFELKYANDQTFRAEVDLQAEVLVSINNYCATQSIVDTPVPTPKLVWLKHGLRAAAMIALVAMAGLMFQNTEDNTPIAETKQEKKNNSKACESITFHTGSTIVAMVDFYSQCCVPISPQI